MKRTRVLDAICKNRSKISTSFRNYQSTAKIKHETVHLQKKKNILNAIYIFFFFFFFFFFFSINVPDVF